MSGLKREAFQNKTAMGAREKAQSWGIQVLLITIKPFYFSKSKLFIRDNQPNPCPPVGGRVTCTERSRSIRVL